MTASDSNNWHTNEAGGWTGGHSANVSWYPEPGTGWVNWPTVTTSTSTTPHSYGWKCGSCGVTFAPWVPEHQCPADAPSGILGKDNAPGCARCAGKPVTEPGE